MVGGGGGEGGGEGERMLDKMKTESQEWQNRRIDIDKAQTNVSSKYTGGLAESTIRVRILYELRQTGRKEILRRGGLKIVGRTEKGSPQRG